MKRLVFDKHGDPAQVLRIEEAPVPLAAAGELLVRMIRRPVNPYELAMISGGNGSEPAGTQVPGFEGIGIVEAAGSQDLAFTKGQRVIPAPVDLPGTWQEYVTGRPEQFVPVPDNVDDTQAALIVNPLTCLVILREILNIKEGQWVMNTAASTNIGQLLIQLANILGFQLINVVRNRAAEENIRSLGAGYIINTNTDDLITVCERLTKGRGVNAVVDPVGGRTGSMAAKTLAFGGKMLLFSDMSGDSVKIEPMEFISKKLTVAGYTSFHWLNENSYEHKTRLISEIFTLIANEQLILKSDGDFKLEDYKLAIERSKESGRHGKIMLV
ncbi:zinc-dependent alcohol dehydrogenase family protein [Mucilaginibacter lutimaris]|uniref:Zinc-dependent alcohol dehydrogenase family protein n=1 Tax=Mucilaginibacter lutimaris TaxID=931629 RepID=A0ABW2ZEE2_9SPHI